MKLLRSTPMSITTLRTTRKFITVFLNVNILSKYFDVQRHQSDYSFDLTLKGVSKAVGIEKLVERINRNIDDTIAFGDGRNDIEMLETVKIGVAMGNAVDEAKAVANYETDRIENDGIVKALKHFELI